MSAESGSNSAIKRIAYLEAKCSFLCHKLSEIITEHTEEGRSRIDPAAFPAPPSCQPTPPHRFTDVEIFVAGAFQSILGRPPSEGDLAFYAATLAKHGPSRVVRDILLSRESMARNSINYLVAGLLRIFWRT